MGCGRRQAIALVLPAILMAGCAAIESSTFPATGRLSTPGQNCPGAGLTPQPPMIPFGVQSVSVLNVCISGDTLRATTSDGTVLQKPAAGIPRDYQIGEGCVVGNGEMGGFRIFSYSPYTIPICK